MILESNNDTIAQLHRHKFILELEVDCRAVRRPDCWHESPDAGKFITARVWTRIAQLWAVLVYQKLIRRLSANSLNEIVRWFVLGNYIRWLRPCVMDYNVAEQVSAKLCLRVFWVVSEYVLQILESFFWLTAALPYMIPITSWNKTDGWRQIQIKYSHINNLNQQTETEAEESSSKSKSS